MKKALTYWYSFLILLLLITSLAVVSCGKKPAKTETKEIDKSVVTDQEKIFLRQLLERSLAINDSFKKNIPVIKTGATRVQDCDSLCNERILEILRNVNNQKSSGNNGYNLYFDELKRQLVLSVSLGETVNSLKDSIYLKNKEIDRLKSNVLIKEIPKPYIPTIIKYLAGFGAICGAVLIVRFFLFIQSKIPKPL